MAERDVIDEQDRGWRAAARRYMPLVLGILLIGSLGALLYSASSASRDHQRALAEQQRSWEIMALARAFEAKTARAEVTLARYVISLDPDTGRLFQDQWRTAASQLKSLTYATRKSDWQRGNVRALQAAFEQRGKTLSEIGLRTTYDQKMGALAQFHQAGRSQDIKRLTALIDLVIQAENARLRERSLAVSLAGDLARFQLQRTACPFDFDGMGVKHILSFICESSVTYVSAGEGVSHCADASRARQWEASVSALADGSPAGGEASNNPAP